MDKIVTVIAPVNIAVIKYCKSMPKKFQTTLFPKCFVSGGKRDENLILPLNDSVSCTLDMEHVSILIYNMACDQLLNIYDSV